MAKEYLELTAETIKTMGAYALDLLSRDPRLQHEDPRILGLVLVAAGASMAISFGVATDSVIETCEQVEKDNPFHFQVKPVGNA